jgi:tRNA A-37 threonylcarbamoyl transferase component Bud32/tetratricopeptide (TPR) repeat protein
MSPENWRRVDTIYEQVQEKDPQGLKQFLDTTCADDPPEVRAKVDELLRSPQEPETTVFDEVRRQVTALLSTDDAVDKAHPVVPGCEILPAPVGEVWPKEGGMGVIWRARDLQLGCDVAIKVMKAKFAGTRWVRYFFAEARITAQLAHPSIVPVRAMGRLADGRPFFTMKLVEGQSLAEKLHAEPDVKSRRTEMLLVFASVCQALAFAHRKGVIHRDPTPSNVMVGEHGEVQVMDWGVAKYLAETDAMPSEVALLCGAQDECNESTGFGQVLGKWAYMPPEQANGKIKEVDRRSDVFALGAMLCEILTGRPPYVGPTREDVIRQACNSELADAYAALAKCGADRELIALAYACLSAMPDDRPEDASKVEKRLTDYLTSVEERLRKAKLARQRMLWVTVGLASTLVALLAASLFAWQAQEAKVKRLKSEWDLQVAQERYDSEKRQHALDMALTAAMSGDLDKADQEVAEAEAAGASPGQVHMLRGQIALHRGQSAEAIRHLEKAVELLPKSVAARGMLAAAYADDGHWERFDRTIREMEELTPLTAEDFLFKGYAWANLEPEQGLQMIKQAVDFDRRPRPMVGIALLLRAEVRAFVAQDTDNLAEAEGAVLDARYAREFLRDNPTAIWVSLEAHLAKAAVHEHRAEREQRQAELEQRQAELELAGKDAEALKRFTKPPDILPEAVVFRWTYFREVGKEEVVLDELRLASEKTEHVNVTSCCALALYRRGQRGDLEEAHRVLARRANSYADRLLPFVLAELDYPDKHDWPARALEASKVYAERTQDWAAVMDAQSIHFMLGNKKQAVEVNKALLLHPDRFYTLRAEPIRRCVQFNVGEITANKLLEAAGSSQWDQCLAHYNIAMRMLADGDRDGAREHFDKAIKTRASGWGEYDLSWVFRDRLEKDPNWPPRIPQGREQ